VQRYRVEIWIKRGDCGKWETDFTSDDLNHIQQVLSGRQKPLKDPIRILMIEDITSFFELV